MTITAETLKAYDHLRAAHPSLTPEVAFQIAQDWRPVALPELTSTQLYPSAPAFVPAVGGFAEMPEIALPEKVKHTRKFVMPKSKWNRAPGSKDYVLQADKAGIPMEQITKNLETHFGLKDLTVEKVEIMAWALRKGRSKP